MGLPARPQRGKLTRCYKTKPRNTSLTDKKVFRALGICVCVIIFAISHLYLRFSIADANVEFRELQRQKAALETAASRLEHEVTNLSDLGKLQEKAVNEFGLIQDEVPSGNLAVIPRNLISRYSDAPVAVPVRPNQHHEILVGEDVQKLTAMERVFEKILDASTAVAQPER